MNHLTPLHAAFRKYQRVFWRVASFVLVSALFFDASDAFAVRAGEMSEAVTYLDAIVRGNVARAVVTVGVAAGIVYSLMKSSLAPFALSVSTGIGYAFATRWIDSAYGALI